MKKIVLLLATLLILSCGKKGSPGAPDPEPIPAPGKTLLILPTANELCLSGTVVSLTETNITFQWSAAANAESYEVTIKNLETNAVSSQTTNSTTLIVKLLRNTPYSWWVNSKSTKSTVTTASDTWRFFNAGFGVTAYAPYPAEITSPTMAQAINAVGGKINLSWKGADVDNDIASYDVYLGTTTTPSLISNVTTSYLNDVSVTPKTTYYWKVITKDSKGNTSDSGIFSFRTL